jgi:hypothetical protein
LAATKAGAWDSSIVVSSKSVEAFTPPHHHSIGAGRRFRKYRTDNSSHILRYAVAASVTVAASRPLRCRELGNPPGAIGVKVVALDVGRPSIANHEVLQRSPFLVGEVVEKGDSLGIINGGARRNAMPMMPAPRRSIQARRLSMQRWRAASAS